MGERWRGEEGENAREGALEPRDQNCGGRLRRTNRSPGSARRRQRLDVIKPGQQGQRSADDSATSPARNQRPRPTVHSNLARRAGGKKILEFFQTFSRNNLEENFKGPLWRPGF